MPNVVIVDDQATDRQILERLTRNLSEDIRIHAFARPGKALEWLREYQPDLILVDYRMPEMDGLAFVKALTDIPSCTGIPTIVITVIDDIELRYRALEAGATDFLTKPLDLQECEARCHNLLTLRRQQLTISRHAQRLAEARRRTGRALRTLSLGNELLIAAQSERDLLLGIGRIVSEQAGYPLVRIALWDDDNQLHEVACAPADANENISTPTSPDLESLIGQIRSTGDPRVFNNFSSEAPDHTGTSRFQDAGFLSAALLPIRIEGLIEGIMAVFSYQAEAFDQDEVELLVRMSNNLGYGLAACRTRRARERAERDFRYLTHFDRLTGLPNRNLLLERLRELLENGEQDHAAAVLVINLDRFKLVNDTTGHQAGDYLLMQVVRRLQAIVRERDLLARQSGDEFVLLTRMKRGGPTSGQTDPIAEDSARMAQRVIDTMRRPFRVAGYEYYIGASIGINRIHAADTDLQSILRQADTAMREAKRAGGNSYSFYTGELTERHTRRLSLEARLHRAIEQESFALHYQPIVELDSGQTVGVEALARWPQEDGSLLEPDAFIPLAEETGLMERLGHWVARTAFMQAREWQNEGILPYMSVNLSVHQLLRPRIIEELAELIESSGVQPSRLELEVTESAMMTDPARTERIVRTLHERGVGIALDDFGIGYSSLSRLKYLPITTLKIDKTFILGLPSDPAERTIVRSIMQLANNLQVRAVAEGIESVEHQSILRTMGCLLGQGFYFSHPLPKEELRTLLLTSGSTSRHADTASPRRQ